MSKDDTIAVMRADVSRVKKYFLVALCSVVALCVLPSILLAQIYSSTDYMVVDPVQFSGFRSDSTGFSLIGSISQIGIGTSTATNYILNGGFLYYPFASSPVVSASAGDAKVDLSWSASTGDVGWTVSGYNIGRSTASGGPYSYTSVGNLTSKEISGLSNGTTYYFIVRPEDAFGNSLATSSAVSATPVAATPVTPPAAPAGGGGGGGGGIMPSATPKITLSGYSYPAAQITILKDAILSSKLLADQNGLWQVDVPVSGAGIYTFSLYATDAEGGRSLTLSYTVTLPQNVSQMTLSDIVITPTIYADKSQVKFGDDIKFYGSAYPQADVNVVVHSTKQIVATTSVNKFGLWSYSLNSSILERGDHTTKSQATLPNGLKSSFSGTVAFAVGDENLGTGNLASTEEVRVTTCSTKGDLNNDTRINITDFSILLYFWKQTEPKNPCADINRDKIVNLFDFSVMLYWWTG